jgi:WD40 repeat protein
VDTKTGETVKNFGQAIWFKESPDGKTLAVYRTENDIDLYAVGIWSKPYKTLHYAGGKNDYYDFYHTPAGGMCFSPDGKKLAVLNNAWGRIVLFDLKTGDARVLLGGDAFQSYFKSYQTGLDYIPVYWNEEGTEITAVYSVPYLGEYRGGVTINVSTGAVKTISAGIHYEQSPDGLRYLRLDVFGDVLRVYSAASDRLLYSLWDCDWACFGNGGLLLTTNEDARLTTVRHASNGSAISSFEETTKIEDAPYSWYSTSFDGKYISVTSNYIADCRAVIRLASTGEAIQEIPEAWKLAWSPVDYSYSPQVFDDITCIAKMPDLGDAMQTALFKLGGRTLSDEEREKYWLG